MTTAAPAPSQVDAPGATDVVRERLRRHRDVVDATLGSACVEQTAEVAELITQALRAGRLVMFFGNGGSSTDAQHLSAELLGRFYRNRRPLPALSLADNMAAITAIGNDFDYREIFSRQVQAFGQPGDVAVALTTSGNSGNVVEALRTARALGMATVAVTGAAGGAVAEVAQICLRVPSQDTPRIQELTMVLGHTICEIAEQRLFEDTP